MPRPCSHLFHHPFGFRRNRKGIKKTVTVLLAFASASSFVSAQVTLTVLDGSTGKPTTARIHLKDTRGVPHRPERLPFWRDHFVCDGKVQLNLPEGKYAYEIERGPEFSAVTNSFLLGSSSTNITLTIGRLADMAAEGWWSGDLHVHRSPSDSELLMRAEDLHVAQVITWWNKQNRWTSQSLPASPLVRFDGDRFYHMMAGEDERDGGALLYFGLNKPFDITVGERFYPHSLQFAREIRKTPGVWVDIEKPFWWDFPAWIAAGVADSVGIANNHMYRTGMYENEAWGRPRDSARLPNPLGNGLWTQEIYYHLLNCGIRLPPSAGSASGVLPNPVGYDRVYVQVDDELTWDKWWDGLRAGRAFVSNGPLLRCRVNGQLPGHVFKVRKVPGTIDAVTFDGAASLPLTATLTSRDRIKSVEVVENGKVVRKLSLPADGKPYSLGINPGLSGWFLIRAIADESRTFRFASTAPFFVESSDAQPRISRSSAQFFLDWVRERMEKLQAPVSSQQEELLSEWRVAENFWKQKVAKANAD